MITAGDGRNPLTVCSAGSPGLATAQSVPRSISDLCLTP